MIDFAVGQEVEIYQMAILLVVVLGIAFLCLIVFPYLFVFPLFVASALRFSGDPDVIEFLPEESPPPQQVASFFSEANEELSRLGFERLSACVLPSPLVNVTAVTTLYVNPTTTDAAMVAAIWAKSNKTETIQAQFVEFMSEFFDYKIEAIETSNIVDVDPFKTPENRLRFRFPSLVGAASISSLYKFHQAIVEEHAPGRKKVLKVCDEFRNDVPTYLKEDVLVKSYDRQVKFGLLKYYPDINTYAPTSLGVYRMVWKLLPPFKGFIQATERRREKELRQKHANKFV